MSSIRLSPAGVHEAGHALGLLIAGVRVQELHVAPDGSGHCLPAAFCREPDDDAVSILCGPVAVQQILGDVHGSELSGVDRELLNRAAEDYAVRHGLALDGRMLRTWEHRAWLAVHEHRTAVMHLAQRLGALGTMTERDLSEWVHRPGSALAQFRSLYPPPHRCPDRRASVG